MSAGVRPGVRAEAYQELLWFDPTAPSEGPDELPTSRLFADLGLVVGRTSWAPDAVLVSFKASPGGGHKAWETSHRIKAETGWTTLNAGHHHPDAGTFVLLGNGAYLALDEGYSSRKRTEHHNAVLVDGTASSTRTATTSSRTWARSPRPTSSRRPSPTAGCTPSARPPRCTTALGVKVRRTS